MPTCNPTTRISHSVLRRPLRKSWHHLTSHLHSSFWEPETWTTHISYLRSNLTASMRLLAAHSLSLRKRRLEGLLPALCTMTSWTRSIIQSFKWILMSKPLGSRILTAIRSLWLPVFLSRPLVEAIVAVKNLPLIRVICQVRNQRKTWTPNRGLLRRRSLLQQELAQSVSLLERGSQRSLIRIQNLQIAESFPHLWGKDILLRKRKVKEGILPIFQGT